MIDILLSVVVLTISPVIYVLLRISYFTINYFLWRPSYSGIPRLQNPLSALQLLLKTPDIVEAQNKELNIIGGGKMPPVAFMGPTIDNGKPLLVVCTADLLREVADESRFEKHKSFYDPLAVLLGDGLVTATGENWKVHRRVINPLFYSNKIKVFSEAMVENASKMVAELKQRQGEVINVPRFFSVVTQKVLIDTLFSGKIDSLKTAALWHEAAVEYFAYRLCNVVVGHTINKLLPFRKHVLAARLKLKEVIQPLIDEARQEARLIDEEQRDLIQTLVTAVDDNGNPIFSDDAIIEESLTMLFAGHDTSKNAISWAIFFLAKDPAEMRKLVDEVKDQLSGRQPTFDDIPKLRCCRNALQEALRLQPPVTGMNRCALRDCQLGEYFIPKGTSIRMGFGSAMVDELVWEAPFTYKPDRFNSLETHQSRSFVPFSLGDRNCIGQKFVITEGIIILATLVQHFSFEMACTKVEAILEGTLTPKGFLCKFVSL